MLLSITYYKAARGNLLSSGSVDNKFATWAAEASKPSKSSGASSERSPTSNPDLHHNSFSEKNYKQQNLANGKIFMKKKKKKTLGSKQGELSSPSFRTNFTTAFFPSIYYIIHPLCNLYSLDIAENRIKTSK